MLCDVGAAAQGLSVVVVLCDGLERASRCACRSLSLSLTNRERGLDRFRRSSKAVSAQRADLAASRCEPDLEATKAGATELCTHSHRRSVLTQPSSSHPDLPFCEMRGPRGRKGGREERVEAVGGMGGGSMGVATCGELSCALRGYMQPLSTRAWSLRGCERCGEVRLMRSEEDEGKAVSSSSGLLSGSVGERG